MPDHTTLSPDRRPRDDEIDVFGLTHIGRVRHINQDHFLLATIHRRVDVLQTSLTDFARLEMAESEYIVRGVGYIRSLDDLGAVSTGVSNKGKTVLLRDVAELRFGPAPRNGTGIQRG